jgi:hypothetical protein
VKEEETMQEITTVGLDLAKNLLHLIGCNEHGKEVKRKMLKRGQQGETVLVSIRHPARVLP